MALCKIVAGGGGGGDCGTFTPNASTPTRIVCGFKPQDVFIYRHSDTALATALITHYDLISGEIYQTSPNSAGTEVKLIAGSGDGYESWKAALTVNSDGFSFTAINAGNAVSSMWVAY